MTGVSAELKEDIRESLNKADAHPDGLIPLATMPRYYCSLTKRELSTAYLHLMELEVDGKQVFVYFKL